MTLFYTTPLISPGLSGAMAFTGLFTSARRAIDSCALAAAAVGAVWPEFRGGSPVRDPGVLMAELCGCDSAGWPRRQSRSHHHISLILWRQTGKLRNALSF